MVAPCAMSEQKVMQFGTVAVAFKEKLLMRIIRIMHSTITSQSCVSFEAEFGTKLEQSHGSIGRRSNLGL